MQRVIRSDDLRLDCLVQTDRGEVENLRLHFGDAAATVDSHGRLAQQAGIRARLVAPARAEAAATDRRAADGRHRLDLFVARPPVELAFAVLRDEHDVRPPACGVLLLALAL